MLETVISELLAGRTVIFEKTDDPIYNYALDKLDGDNFRMLYRKGKDPLACNFTRDGMAPGIAIRDMVNWLLKKGFDLKPHQRKETVLALPEAPEYTLTCLRCYRGTKIESLPAVGGLWECPVCGAEHTFDPVRDEPGETYTRLL